ncbi:Transcription factor AP-2-beta [Aphelenchoides bicaudatus]|nr:Transcription factor AP-2-beta [Aphelenchoides bicaudatus]
MPAHAEFSCTTTFHMLTNQSHGSAFLQLGNSQPIQTHSFHGFQLKQESEPEPSSDESSFGEHGGVIKKVQRIKNPKDFSNDKLTVISPDLSNIVQQQNCSSQSNHFCFVPGRLSLLSSSAKYEVTVDEIGRRINPPESLNASVLGSILRRAKAKDGGKSLRDKLKTHGLVLPAGRRKASNVNSLTALVEHEASQLAGDFERLCENDFPARSMAEYLTRHSDSMALEQRKQLIHLTKQLIGEFCEILSKDGSPLCSNNLPSHTLEPSIQKPLTHFSLVTHGFGSRAVNAGLNAFTNYLDETLKLLDTK